MVDEDSGGLVNVTSGGLEDGLFGALVPRFNGFLSALGCGLMIYIILKSRVKLSSTYHRIMFIISLNGLFASAAFGCSYWLFPRGDELLSWPYLISENINRLGNTLTCDIQATLVFFGTYVFQGYVASLCLYYLCAMVLRMRPETITKYVEWFLHLSPIIIGFIPVIYGLKTNSFNPGDTTPWCAFRRYPAACPTHCWAPDDEGCECIRGGPEYDRVYYTFVYSISLYFYTTVIFTCLIAIFVSTIVSNIKLRIYIHKSKSGSEGSYDREMEDTLRFRDTNYRSTLLQTFLYISIMLVVFVSLFLTKTVPVDGKGYEAVKGLRIFAITIQGLVFFVIFFFIKVQNVRWSHSETTIWEAMKQVFQDPPDDIILLNLQAISNPNQRSGAQAINDPDGSVAVSTFRTPLGADIDYDGSSSIDMTVSAFRNDLEGFRIDSFQQSVDEEEMVDS